MKQEFGSSLPSGGNVSLAIVEAIGQGTWAPEERSELAGKDITYAETVNGYSTHAYEVAAYLIGSSRSILPEVSRLRAASRSQYAYKSLWAGSNFFPVKAEAEVENHSWGADFGLDNTQVIQRMDYRVNRDGVLIVAGIDNGSSNRLSPVVANLYNGITVGVTSGAHARGGSTLEGGGRQKPDLVAPGGVTSHATPMVASSGQFLLGEVKRTSALAAARHPAAIKAILLAGATKSGLTWSHTETQPLDKVYGAGELDLYNSYKLLKAGRVSPGAADTSGWDVTTTTTEGRVYYFDVPSGKTATLSAVLAWHRLVKASGANWNTSPGAQYSGTSYARVPTELVNLDLTLWRVQGGKLSGVEARSAGTIDNVEHLYELKLAPGRYAIEVEAPKSGATYALAWRTVVDGTSVVSTPTPPPAPEPAPEPEPVPTGGSLLTAVNLGAVGIAGLLDFDAAANDYVIAGAGAGIAGWSDALYYASESITGNATTVVRIDALGGGTGARAGLSWRNTADPKSPHVSLVTNRDGNLSLIRRQSSTSQVIDTVSAGALPVWVRLVRSGDTFTAAYSENGTSWTSIATVTVDLASAARTGLAVSSGTTVGAATAEFSRYDSR